MALHLHELGDAAGAPLVCLHGLSGHGLRFGRLAGLLAGRRVLAPDLRGHARSSWAAPWDVATHVADVLATADAAGIERSDWLGFSYGGRIAAAIAAAVPERVGRLVLLDPALHVEPGMASDEASLELEPEVFASADQAIDARLAAGTLFSTPRGRLEEDAAVHLARGEDGLLRWSYSRPMAITAWSEMALPAPPVAPVPTLLVTGTRSWLPVDAERLRGALGERLTHVELDAGHNVLWDAEAETAAAVGQFLNQALGTRH